MLWNKVEGGRKYAKTVINELARIEQKGSGCFRNLPNLKESSAVNIRLDLGNAVKEQQAKDHTEACS